MKLTRIRVDQFRQFRRALEIDRLDPGLNLFTGPNEAGKSTLVAAIRAAFFERHRSASVDDLRPWGDPAAAPTVALDFELDGQPCRLVKTFLAKKRCTLQIGSETVDGEEAENRLAALLGFQHAGRGASKAEHWGIPGLLWIEQGGAQALREAVGHAGDHLRGALERALGEVAASGGDALLATVEAQRAELLTEAGGRPRGAYKEALEAEAALAGELGVLDDAIARYRQRVDALAALRDEHAADEAEQPWRAFRTHQQAAAERLAAVREREAMLAATRTRAAQVDAQLALLRSQVDGFAREDEAAAARAAALEAARAALDSARAPLEHWTAQRVQAAQALETARATLRAARQAEARDSLAREAAASHARHAAGAAQLARAEAAHAQVLALQHAVAANELRPADLQTLRTQDRALADLRLQQAAAATRLVYVLEPGRTLELDGAPLSGAGERRLLAAASLVLPGFGRLQIAPGGADLAALAARGADLEARQQALLVRLGLGSVDAAERRQLEHARLGGELATAQATLEALAPGGIDALRAEHARLQARAAEAAQALARLAAPASAEGEAAASASAAPSAAASVIEAEAAEKAAADALAAIQEGLHRAQLAAANAETALAAAARELAAARAQLAAPERARRVADASAALTDTRAEQLTLAARSEALAAEIAAARPDILEQDVDRFRSSAEQLERRHAERRDQLVRLEIELQSEGAQGLEARRAECARDHAWAARRAAELRRRAQALDLLRSLLRDQRRALTRRLQAPLQKHLNRYLQLLFPHACVDIDDDLVPGPLTRPLAGAGAGGGVETGDFEALSFGAREQMGVLSRLAYADLLAEAGRPTLVILDDALVHSDAERLAQMKRVLFDAATRHQILLFTCHPAAWRDLGTGARSLAALRAD
ncbi:AAA family ATPase [Thauera aromatica]|uniref:DNA double-strand break repair Rad50 ATPase n=1 Tax=Thauera aromatica K172 TaxID=44139 RepID=A0A2R4BIK9_THAAR|nr:AAA family ATPase [Thauera aromatica]AVR87034.1 DNA double-strand break repair Rad50 ATPase [Thauera aromatica K172]